MRHVHRCCTRWLSECSGAARWWLMVPCVEEAGYGSSDPFIYLFFFTHASRGVLSLPCSRNRETGALRGEGFSFFSGGGEQFSPLRISLHPRDNTIYGTSWNRKSSVMLEAMYIECKKATISVGLAQVAAIAECVLAKDRVRVSFYRLRILPSSQKMVDMWRAFTTGRWHSSFGCLEFSDLC